MNAVVYIADKLCVRRKRIINTRETRTPSVFRAFLMFLCEMFGCILIYAYALIYALLVMTYCNEMSVSDAEIKTQI